MTKNKFAAAAAALAVATLAQAQPLPTATPESVGMSTERLRNIETFFADEIERNRMPGAVVAIAREGKLVYYKAIGFAGQGENVPMATDTIFPLASMTKPMVVVGALALTEQARLPLKSPLLPTTFRVTAHAGRRRRAPTARSRSSPRSGRSSSRT